MVICYSSHRELMQSPIEVHGTFGWQLYVHDLSCGDLGFFYNYLRIKMKLLMEYLFIVVAQ